MVVRSKAALKASAAFANPGWVMAITTSNSDTEKQKNRGEGVYICTKSYNLWPERQNHTPEEPWNYRTIQM
jgi:hypothetical protein